MGLLPELAFQSFRFLAGFNDVNGSDPNRSDSAAGEPTVYETDARGIIRRVGGGWAPFASANGGEALPGANVIGRPLREFVSDLTTREIYDRLMERALEGHTLSVPFRCDAPDRRRWMRLCLTPTKAGLRFEVHTEREEAREPVELLAAERPVGEGMLNMCGWCKRIEVGSRWLEVELAIEALGLFERSVLPDVSHGICPDCFDHLEAQVA